jgi:hypothetical protein
MPVCKNNPKKSYTGTEPSPKGLGFCASSEKEGTIMKGSDGNMWIKSSGRWVKNKSDENIQYKKLLYKKLYNWWKKLATESIIIIYKDLTNKIIKSNLKTMKAKSTDIKNKWDEFGQDNDVVAIIWSAQSTDTIDFFIDYIIKKNSKSKLDELLKLKNISSYLLENYKKFFIKHQLNSKKDYTFRQ